MYIIFGNKNSIGINNVLSYFIVLASLLLMYTLNYCNFLNISFVFIFQSPQEQYEAL